MIIINETIFALWVLSDPSFIHLSAWSVTFNVSRRRIKLDNILHSNLAYQGRHPHKNPRSSSRVEEEPKVRKSRTVETISLRC